MKYLLSILFLLLSQAACQTTPGQPGKDLDYLAKTDIDTISDIHVQRMEALLRRLTEKLYRRNPGQCQGGTPAIRTCVHRVFDDEAPKPDLAGKRGTASIQLAFDEDYEGDRVLALMFGLRTMLRAAYGEKREFFITDELDPQKLYNSARNIEITVWRLSHYQQPDGQLYLVSNELEGEVKNLSYERLFGKLISLQDTMAVIIAESSQRNIKNMIQRLATAVFLPI
ncbi:hypothetical protein [Sulfuriflexus mobilis]|uniref:hypothetical protein n=1 Tax=Sulfuriflexus mobilis TaxID=1811807 RepID=UPI000F83FF61|nr:hypothetical protein [Sulfuriflexus mobilis]